jgi:hypothetical protein
MAQALDCMLPSSTRRNRGNLAWERNRSTLVATNSCACCTEYVAMLDPKSWAT